MPFVQKSANSVSVSVGIPPTSPIDFESPFRVFPSLSTYLIVIGAFGVEVVTRVRVGGVEDDLPLR